MSKNSVSKKPNSFDILVDQPEASKQAMVKAAKPSVCTRAIVNTAQRAGRGGSPASASQRGRQGARIKADMLKPVKDFVYKLAEERPYPDHYAAGYALAEITCQYAATIDVQMSRYRAPRTIAGWLKNKYIVLVINM